LIFDLKAASVRTLIHLSETATPRQCPYSQSKARPYPCGQRSKSPHYRSLLSWFLGQTKRAAVFYAKI